MTLISALLTGLAVVILTSSASDAQAAGLEALKAKGEITIGVKEDYPPFGFRSVSGELIGLEIDLARDIADRLGVKLKLFPVSAASRLQFLQQDMIDVVIATMSVTEDRKTQAGLIEPSYYASAPAFLLPQGSAVASLAGLDGKPVCTISGAYYNDELTAKAPNITLIMFRSLREAAKVLSDGQCAALAGENTHLLYLGTSNGERWRNYEVIPFNAVRLPWAIAVRSGQERSDFGRFLSNAITDWHKSGKLIALEKQWLGRNTEWLIDRHKELK